jgi:O-glycosyl hydrolase
VGCAVLKGAADANTTIGNHLVLGAVDAKITRNELVAQAQVGNIKVGFGAHAASEWAASEWAAMSATAHSAASAAAHSLTRVTMTAHSAMRMDIRQEERSDKEEDFHV